MSTKKLIVPVGPAGSGKSSWANKYAEDHQDEEVKIIERDWVRFNLIVKNDGVRDWDLYEFSKKNEREVTKICDTMVKGAIKDQVETIIISDTNLTKKYRDRWKELAAIGGYLYEEKPFTCDWETLVKRNNNRQGGISLKVLRDQYLRFQKYIGRNVYYPDTSKRGAFIVDIDGTIADMEGIRKPYEWDKVLLDKPRKEIIAIVHGLWDRGLEPVFVSGRDGCCKKDTAKWLSKYVWNAYFGEELDPDFYLFMRNEGDNRKDSVVKEEIFWKYIAKNFNVVAAIDDRHSVLNLWEELGIPNIINVNGGLYNEF